METETEAPVAQIDGDTSATASFIFDRLTVERFRKSFPRARWSDEKKAWIVPGKTASRRVESWLAQIEADIDGFADAKGRDAFEFDPIATPYLEVAPMGFRIRTPYSRTVVSELRAVPFSQWDGDLRLWHISFRSVDDLRRHCFPGIKGYPRATVETLLADSAFLLQQLSLTSSASSHGRRGRMPKIERADRRGPSY